MVIEIYLKSARASTKISKVGNTIRMYAFQPNISCLDHHMERAHFLKVNRKKDLILKKSSRKT